MAKLPRLLRILRLRGSSYLWYLLVGYAWPRFVAGLAFDGWLSAFFRRLVSGVAKHAIPSRRVSRRPADPEGLLYARDWLPEETWAAALSVAREHADEPLVLGEIDNDGRVKTEDWVRGSLPDIDVVDAESFEPRPRHGLELVLDLNRTDGAILIRKDFRGDEQAFRHELQSLTALSGIPWSPEVFPWSPEEYRAEEPFHLYRSFVPGPTVRQVLVDAGAHILSTETDVDPELAELDGIARIEEVWARGRECFHALPEDFFDQLESHLNAMHRKGVTGFSLTFGNIVLRQRKRPWFIDFDHAEWHRPSPATPTESDRESTRGLLFAIRRDHDRKLYNRIYGREILTERSARRLARKLSTPYAPFDLGGGIATRGFWSVDSGKGRWEVLNRRVMSELIDGGGRRILDLGSFNGLMPLLMLRAGAQEVVAVEKSAEMVGLAKDLRRLFEWRDMRSYEQLDLRCADMRAILEEDWGAFDLVTAFCSLYYLDEEDMRRVVHRAAELAPILVLQAKTDTRRDAAADKAKKSSVGFLKTLIEDHGFPDCEVVTMTGYTRPILIGRRTRW